MILALIIILCAGIYAWWTKFSTQAILLFFFCVVFASVMELSYQLFRDNMSQYKDRYYELDYLNEYYWCKMPMTELFETHIPDQYIYITEDLKVADDNECFCLVDELCTHYTNK
jgi:hypothetical protein